MDRHIDGLISYLKASPTCFQAVDELKRILIDAQYTELNECDPWTLEKNGRYYVTRNGSSLIAFTIPAEGNASFRIVSAHTDSPTYKIKENAELQVEGKYVRLDVEKCGGSICSTWLDRPLSVAGRVIVRTANGIESVSVNVSKDLLMIPNVAIHMNRTINDGYQYQLNTDLMPLWGSGDTKGSFLRVIAEAAGIDEHAIIGHDLYLYNREEPKIWGCCDEYISAGHLDDLECVYTGLSALLEAAPGKHINVLAAFDNEEVGSLTKQGADSTFLADVLSRLCTALGYTHDEYLQALRSTFMLSADNAHAVHPNHPELCDPVNRVYMNEGIVIKHNASQKYTTDGISEAVFHAICKDAGVPVQHFANRSDMAGGSTLGNLSNRHVSINTVDIGLAQLAMHSSYETAGVKDVEYMIQGMKAFYEAEIRAKKDGVYAI